MKKMLALVVVLLALAAPVRADETYVGIAAGSTEIEVNPTIFNTFSQEFDDEETGWKVYVGHEFMKHFSAEIGWQNLGRFSQTQPSTLFGDLTFDGEVDGIWVDAIGKLPLGRVFDIYGKVGLFFWNTDFTVVNDMNDLAFFSKQTGVDFSYGAGVGFNIARFTIRLEYQEFSTDDTDKLTFASLGLQFNF